MTQPAIVRRGALGRPTVASRAELEQISLAMFSDQGFEVTSVDEIASAAGIGRRTFFRYFKSKNDAVWDDFDTQLAAFAAWFDRRPAEIPVVQAICAAAIDFNSFGGAATASLRNRMRVILSSPALQAYSTLRYPAWRQAVSNYAAGRLDVDEQALPAHAVAPGFGRGPGCLRAIDCRRRQRVAGRAHRSPCGAPVAGRGEQFKADRLMTATDRPLAVIAGAARGTGAAVAERLTAEGLDLVLTDVSDADPATVVGHPLGTTGKLGAVAESCRSRSGQVPVPPDDVQGSTRTAVAERSATVYGLSNLEEFTPRQRLDRLVEPAEISAAVSWLCGRGAIAVTGAAIRVDGGSVG